MEDLLTLCCVSGSNAGVLGGVIAFLAVVIVVCLLVITAIIFYFRRRHQNGNRFMIKPKMSFSSIFCNYRKTNIVISLNDFNFFC